MLFRSSSVYTYSGDIVCDRNGAIGSARLHLVPAKEGVLAFDTIIKKDDSEKEAKPFDGQTFDMEFFIPNTQPALSSSQDRAKGTRLLFAEAVGQLRLIMAVRGDACKKTPGAHYMFFDEGRYVPKQTL